MKIKRLVLLSFLLSGAIVLNLAEFLFIPSSVLPGVKFGLTNIIILIILYKFGIKDALFVSLVRVFVTSLIFGNIFQMAFLMSLFGALISLLSMWLLKVFFGRLSIVTISTVGAFFHVVSQVAVSAIYLQTIYIFYYLPILMISSIGTGIIVGIISRAIIKTKIFDQAYYSTYQVEEIKKEALI